MLIVGAGSRHRSNFLAVALLSLLVVLMALLLVEAEKFEKNIEHKQGTTDKLFFISADTDKHR